MNRSESITELLAAMIAAKKEFPPIVKDRTAKVKTKSGAEYEYQYANLASILEIIQKPLHDHGLQVIQGVGKTEGTSVCVETMLVHLSGQFISEVASIPVVAMDPQATGSAITYCRRYGLTALLELAPDEDDDAARAKKGGKGTRTDPKSHSPAMIAWCALSEEKRKELSAHIGPMVDYLNDDLPLEAVGYLERKVPDQEEQVALWSQFDSVQRRAMKDAEAARRTRKEAH